MKLVRCSAGRAKASMEIRRSLRWLLPLWKRLFELSGRTAKSARERGTVGTGRGHLVPNLGPRAGNEDRLTLGQARRAATQQSPREVVGASRTDVGVAVRQCGKNLLITRL
jgi:hypothetical protein